MSSLDPVIMMGLYCLMMGLYCLMVGLYCLMMGLYCLMMGLYCLMVGLYCPTLTCSPKSDPLNLTKPCGVDFIVRILAVYIQLILSACIEGTTV